MAIKEIEFEEIKGFTEPLADKLEKDWGLECGGRIVIRGEFGKLIGRLKEIVMNDNYTGEYMCEEIDKSIREYSKEVNDDE